MGSCQSIVLSFQTPKSNNNYSLQKPKNKKQQQEQQNTRDDETKYPLNNGNVAAIVLDSKFKPDFYIRDNEYNLYKVHSFVIYKFIKTFKPSSSSSLFSFPEENKFSMSSSLLHFNYNPNVITTLCDLMYCDDPRYYAFERIKLQTLFELHECCKMETITVLQHLCYSHLRSRIYKQMNSILLEEDQTILLKDLTTLNEIFSQIILEKKKLCKKT